MADKFGIPSDAEVEAICLAYFQAQPTIGDAPLGEGTFEGDLARALAGCLGTVLQTERDIYNDGIPGVIVDETGAQKTLMSTQGLDLWAFTLGLPSNKGAGKYGRNGSQPAKGGGGFATGTPGTIVPTGTQLTDPSGQVILQLRSGVTIPVSGSIAVTLDAVTTGKAGNLPAGTLLRWQSPPVGLSSSLTLTSATVDGADTEENLQLALRVLDFLQHPPEGGTAADYKRWTLAAQDVDGRLLGIVGAYVYPHKAGTLTVSIIPLLGGSGAARDPGATKQAQVQAWLDGLRIVTDTVIVERPLLVSADKLTIFLRLLTAQGFAFDWNYTGTLPTILSGTGTSLVINLALPPPELQQAIDNGAKPRIHTNLSTSPIPFQSRVTAYQANTPALGQCTLTLETSLPVAPSGTSLLWPGGPAVLPVALAVLAYVDSVGPSRQSGYAAEVWEDSVSVARIAQTAIDARDATGAKVVMTLPNTGNYIGPPVGVQIQVGAGAANTQDFALYDNGSGAQIPEVAAILMRPF